ncbi:hypothetical protein ACA910_014443 [Epithemia clementina (nom. ined.)]
MSAATRNLRRFWKSLPLSRLKQGSTLSIRSNVPITNVVLRSAWRDDGHVELKQVFHGRRRQSPLHGDGTASGNNTAGKKSSKSNNSEEQPPLEFTEHAAAIVDLSVTQHQDKQTSMDRWEPHISIDLTASAESKTSPPTTTAQDRSTNPPLSYINTVAVKKEMDRVILDDGTIHPISDPEIESKLDQQQTDSSAASSHPNTNNNKAFIRTDYNDGIAHLESISSSEQTVASTEGDAAWNDEENNETMVGIFLSLDVPEKLNVICHLNQGGSIRICNKFEGDATLSTTQGDIQVQKIRGHEIHLSSQQGTVYASDVLEAQSVSIQALGVGGRVRAKQIYGTFVNVRVSENREEADDSSSNSTNNKNDAAADDDDDDDYYKNNLNGGQHDPSWMMDTDDEGSLIDVSALYVSGNGGATLRVDNVPQLECRAVRVKTIHGPVRVETSHLSRPNQFNALLVPPERYPLVELGGINGNCEVEITNVVADSNSMSSPTEPTTSLDESWSSCTVHVDSLAPESVSMLSTQEGDVRITMDRKTEADLRLLSLPVGTNPEVVTKSCTLLAEEEDSPTMLIHDILSAEFPLNAKDDAVSNNKTGKKRILIETKAFSPNPASPSSSSTTLARSKMEYVEGWVENKSAEPDSRFERKMHGNDGRGGGGKIRIDDAADQALHGFRNTESKQQQQASNNDVNDQESSPLRPLFVAVGTGRIRLETLSWVGAIARRYGLDDGNRGLGRTATRRGRELVSTVENDAIQ